MSASLEVLETLEIENSLSNLESRLDSLEIDIARLTGSREDDSRRIAGEVAVMKARVEDALKAFAGTADELRDTASALGKRLETAVAGSLGDGPALRAELRAGIDGVMAGVGDVLESVMNDVRQKIEGLGSQMNEIRDGMERVAGQVVRTVDLERDSVPEA